MQTPMDERYLLVRDPDAPDQYRVYQQHRYPVTPGRDGVPEDEFRSLLDAEPAEAVRLDPDTGADVIKIAKAGSLGIDP